MDGEAIGIGSECLPLKGERLKCCRRREGEVDGTATNDQGAR